MVWYNIVFVALRYATYLFIPWGLLVFGYRMTLDPLRGYPGPFMAQFTIGYGAFYALGRRNHTQTYKNIQKYGPVHRAGPNRLMFNSLSAMKDIYDHPHITKSYAYRAPRWIDKPNLFDVQDNRDHRRRRQAIGQVVSDRTLRSFEPTMNSQITVFLQQLMSSSHQAKAVNMTIACKRLAVDVVGHLAFGYELKTQTEDTNHFISDAMGKSVYLANLNFTWPSLSITLPAIRWLLQNQARNLYDSVHRMILDRQAKPKDSMPDFYSFAIGSNQIGEEGLHHSEFFSEAIFFVLAGGTTVSTAMCAIFFYIVRHPIIYARLADEIRTSFSSQEEICNGPKLAACRYLRAVIDEALRLAPPTLNTMWREPESSYTGPFVVDGHVIPQGTEVGVYIYSILHDPKYFSEPFSFRPECWLGPEEGDPPESPDEEEKRAQMRRAQVSFGLGHRNCAGRSMAYMKVSLVIARSLWYFDFELAPGKAGRKGAGFEGSQDPWATPDQFLLAENLSADHDGPYVMAKPRGEYWRELDVKE